MSRPTNHYDSMIPTHRATVPQTYRWQPTLEQLPVISPQGVTNPPYDRWQPSLEQLPSKCLVTVEDALNALTALTDLEELTQNVSGWWNSSGRHEEYIGPLYHAERIILRAYTMHASIKLYWMLSSIMRGEGGDKFRYLIDPIVVTLHSALTKLPPYPLKEAWRGLHVTNSDVLLKTAFDGSDWNVGDVVTFTAFSSFSMNAVTAAAFSSSPLGGIIFLVRDGIFRDMRPFSAFQREEEFLAIPPTHYRITKRDDTNASQNVVTVEAVPTVVLSPKDLREALAAFFRDPSYHMCPPPVELEDGSAVTYSLDILLRTHQLTYVVRNTGKDGAIHVRSATADKIADIALNDTQSNFALVEAPAGMGKSTMAFMMALSQPQSTSHETLTVLVRLPQLLSIEYHRNASVSLKQHLLRVLLSAALVIDTTVLQHLVDRVFADSSHPTMLLHIVLDGYDEVSAVESDVITDTLRLAAEGLTLRSCRIFFTITSRPVRSHAGSVLDATKAIKFSIQPWTKDIALEYGRQLLSAPNIARLERLDAFSSQLEEVDEETTSIPLLVDILVRRTLSPDDELVVVDEGVAPNSRFGIIQSFVRRNLHWQIKRLLKSANPPAFLTKTQDVDEASEAIETVLRRVAIRSLNGEAVRRTHKESQALWDLVTRSGLLKAVGTEQVFLYKMLCEYFVADSWARNRLASSSGDVSQNYMDARFSGATVLLASAFTAASSEKREILIHSIANNVDLSLETKVLSQQVRCLVASAVELDHLEWAARWCQRQQQDPAALQRVFLPAVATMKSAKQGTLIKVLGIVVHDTSTIPQQAFHVALDARNTSFMLVVKDTYGMTPTPSMAVSLQFTPQTLKESIAFCTKHLPVEKMVAEIARSATLATQSDQPDTLALLFNVFVGMQVNEPLQIDVHEGDRFPLCSTHSCRRTICSESRLDIDIVLPKEGIVRSEEHLDLRDVGRAQVHSQEGHSSRLQDVKSIVAPPTIDFWSWQLSIMPILTSVDLSGMSSVTNIRDGFLQGCNALTSVDLSGLNSVTTIGDGFLAGCTAEKVNLDRLSWVTGNGFPLGCNALTSLNLSELSKVTTIGNDFLWGCNALTSIDLDGLSSVTAMGNGFFGGCTALTSVDLIGLRSLTAIGKRFFHGCDALTTLNLSGLSRVATIGDSFLAGCTALTSVDLSGLSSLTTIGDGFLLGCDALTTLNLSGLSSVTTIGDRFLHGCDALTSVDLSGLTSVTAIGNDFLRWCNALTSVDLRGLSNVTTIGNDFLWGSNALTTVDLSGLSRVTTIGDRFLLGCDALTTVDLSRSISVTKIGDGFLAWCASLTSVDLSGLTSVTTVGNDVFAGCNSLTSVCTSGLGEPMLQRLELWMSPKTI